MTRLALLLALAGFPAAASPIADVVCAPHDQMVAKLRQQFGETMRGEGVRDPETVMQVWSSDSRGTWTMVMAYADGHSCIVAMGEAWMPAVPKDPA